MDYSKGDDDSFSEGDWWLQIFENDPGVRPWYRFLKLYNQIQKEVGIGFLALEEAVDQVFDWDVGWLFHGDLDEDLLAFEPLNSQVGE